MTETFYGPDMDGREEHDRQEREAYCKVICAACPLRMQCLEYTLVIEIARGHTFGVAGGMGEGERKNYIAHLREEGYERSVPYGRELLASLKSFYDKQSARKMKIHNIRRAQ